MQRQTVKTRGGRQSSSNHTPVIDLALTGGICATLVLAAALIWGIGQAIGL
ncbi:MAG: hypothetical protein WCS74_02125 [Dehalococcoidales bacterium]|jgi:hypothetical protein|nr:hypothetical protein [Dehalococcoidales bacterium]MDD3264413.1 hypothetical protein [Dehalococcoidales bacterium]MDD4321954.1 hypothetical protein [Dehalococcoidales bacterium]MDD4794039.1 hypothetical protein [Dehalococcoidales bacterium]MDD5122525.1 hypothetical protein [Dehalococcoidales bacterium]